MKSPEYLSINPMGKVPALQHGDAVVTETGAILAYLAELFPEKRLAPVMGSSERASYLRWLFFVAGPVEAVTTARNEGWLQSQTHQQAMSAGFGRFDDVLNTLLHAVAGKRYVCGDHFTAADLYLASYIGWSMMDGSLPKRPEFEAYATPLLQRAASVRATRSTAICKPPPWRQSLRFWPAATASQAQGHQNL
jgi:glutathione S-transferase